MSTPIILLIPANATTEDIQRIVAAATPTLTAGEIAPHEPTRDELLTGATNHVHNLLDLCDRAGAFVGESHPEIEALRGHLNTLLPSGLAAVNEILAEMAADTGAGE